MHAHMPNCAFGLQMRLQQFNLSRVPWRGCCGMFMQKEPPFLDLLIIHMHAESYMLLGIIQVLRHYVGISLCGRQRA